MKTAVIVSTLAFTILSLNSNAQIQGSPLFEMKEYPKALLEENPNRAGGNLCCYPDVKPAESTAPKGYKPFYISHYGRHGSRSAWGDKYYNVVINTFQKAKADGAITDAADTILKYASVGLEAYAGMDGRLTPRGQREHRHIAERMYKSYPRVFRKGSGQVRAISSEVQRCIISMSSFCEELCRQQKNLDIYHDCGDKFQDYIANECPDQAYKESKVKIDSLLSTMPVDTNALYALYFKNPLEARKYIPADYDGQRFAKAIFYCANGASCFDIDPAKLYDNMPLDLIYKFHSYKNHDLYCRHCASREWGEQRLKNGEKLLNDIIVKADEAIAGGKWVADLRFGHDYPLLTLCSALHLEPFPWGYSFDEVDGLWSCSTMCMGSNLQMIFYRSKKAGKPVLVKFLYNEKETKITGLDSELGFYYDWEKVKNFVL